MQKRILQIGDMVVVKNKPTKVGVVCRIYAEAYNVFPHRYGLDLSVTGKLYDRDELFEIHKEDIPLHASGDLYIPLPGVDVQYDRQVVK